MMQQVIETGPGRVSKGMRLLEHGLTDLGRRRRVDVCEQPLDALCAELERSSGLSITALVTRSSLARASNPRTAGS